MARALSGDDGCIQKGKGGNSDNANTCAISICAIPKEGKSWPYRLFRPIQKHLAENGDH